MKAVTFQGTKDIQVKEVEDPELQQKDDIIVRITSTAICGSDLHIYQGALPAQKDYVIGHEPMGIVEEVGPEVTRVKKGDRVVLPFNISCGANAFIAITIWRASAITQTVIRRFILVVILASRNGTAIILAVRLNFCVFHMGISCPL